MKIPDRISYTPPEAELLYLIVEQALLEGSSTLDDGSEDDEWGNDTY